MNCSHGLAEGGGFNVVEAWWVYIMVICIGILTTAVAKMFGLLRKFLHTDRVSICNEKFIEVTRCHVTLSKRCTRP